MKYNKYLACALLAVFASCSNDDEQSNNSKVAVTFNAETALQSEIVPFVEDGDKGTRVNFEGDQFETGDLIKIRIVAPFTTAAEWGEYTDGNTHDNFWILQWKGEHRNWTNISSAEAKAMNLDLNSDFLPSGSSSIWTLSQATPYIFTATTWTEEVHAVMSNMGETKGTTYTWFNSVFKADQRKLADYKSSDVLWAQQFMQTGADNIHLSFQHKMSALCIDLTSFEGIDFDSSDEIVLTLSEMPDIDQQEILVGNYYAGAIKSGYRPLYGDWQRTACSMEDNGKVLGISRIVESASKVEQVAIESVPQTGTYTAYLDRAAKKCYFIIPPYTVPASATPTLWLRQGTKRWSAELALPAERTFEASKRYTSSLTLQ